MLRAALSLWACAAFAVDDGWFASLRWPPQREQAALNNSHAHHGALLAELRRSLGAFEPAASRSDAKDLLRRALRDPRHRDHVVLVLDGRIFTSKAFAHVSKNAMHLRMLAAAIRRHEPLPNVLMLHDSASDGNCHRTKEGRTLATTVIAKKGGYGQCGVLVPNPYYGRGDTADEWAWFVSELKGRAAKIPLERKRPVAFWRGTLGNHKELCAGDVCTPQNCARDDGNYARFQAMALTVSRPDAFDVKCHKFHPRNASDCAAELPFTDQFRALARDPSPIFDLRWFEAKDYAGFKYLLNLPGETAGSYSRNLNHLWAVGSALLLSVWNSTTGLGGPHQTSELSSSVKSKSIRLIFGRIDCSRGVLEARQKASRRNRRIRSH